MIIIKKMKYNTQILAPKYRTQNGKPPVSRLKRKPCCFSYFTSTSNGNYFRSFPLSSALVLQELHWLPMQARIHFKILAFKCKSSYNLRSNSGILLELLKGKMLETPDKRAFQTAAPHLWNELPLQLRNIQSLETFTNSIKTLLSRVIL